MSNPTEVVQTGLLMVTLVIDDAMIVSAHATYISYPDALKYRFTASGLYGVITSSL